MEHGEEEASGVCTTPGTAPGHFGLLQWQLFPTVTWLPQVQGLSEGGGGRVD